MISLSLDSYTFALTTANVRLTGMYQDDHNCNIRYAVYVKFVIKFWFVQKQMNTLRVLSTGSHGNTSYGCW